jgi:hypothetical protein
MQDGPNPLPVQRLMFRRPGGIWPVVERATIVRLRTIHEP